MTHLLELIDASGVKLFHSPGPRGYIGIPAESGALINVPVRSDAAGLFIRGIAYRQDGKAVPDRDLEAFLQTLDARAIFDGPKFGVFIRVGGDLKTVYHDLGREDGLVVEITGDGHQATFSPTVKLVRTEGMQPLPVPTVVSGCNRGLDRFRRLVNLDGDNWLLLLAFLIGTFRSKGPFACLSVEGERGSGKSVVCELLKQIVDPSTTLRLSMPDDARNLSIMAAHHHLLVFDNLSGLKRDISDALCQLATGGGFQIRKLYTDEALITFAFARPFAMNGISDFIHRADLMDRTIPLHLEAMPDGARRSEDAIRREFEELLPELLGDIYTAVAGAIRNLPTTPVPTELRMADAAQWLTAAEPALGLASGTFVKALKGRQAEAQADLATGDSLFAALEAVIFAQPKKEFEGRAAALLGLLQRLEMPRDRFFPATPSQLSNKLKRLRKSLEQAGIIIEFLPRRHDGRLLKVSLAPKTQESCAARPAPKIGPEGKVSDKF